VIEIAANVTDNLLLDTVLANITFPNSTSQLLTLINTSTDKFNISFTIPALLGQYNITIIANDSSNTINDTETTFFTAVDQIRPEVINITPLANSTFNVSDIIEISANVTDDIGVDTVLANITLPNSTVQQITLTQVGATIQFNNSFTIPNSLQGRYNVTIIANDTSNNVNDTEDTFFNAVDQKNPEVVADAPIANSIFNITTTIEIAANVTDNGIIDRVLANITFSNASSTLINLTQVGATDKFNNSFTIPALVGVYNITFIANDTSGNVNETEKTNFTP